LIDSESRKENKLGELRMEKLKGTTLHEEVVKY